MISNNRFVNLNSVIWTQIMHRNNGYFIYLYLVGVSEVSIIK